ncbi:hypothetical protein [Chryseolinea soli]|uniref:DUF3592 domain-containing protein n=1 Tax=Chryseolinea soli TaxID=2321403 RepID=A0A385SV87_9BACT|nr:hypothetical protein [Chryseolinea soli]AYB34067.1 hypothetical protein D4L85_27345 [Chryseolinea soli]
MTESTKKKIYFAAFLSITIYLVYAHFQAKTTFNDKLEGYQKMIQGKGAKTALILSEKYAVMTTKSKMTETKSMATIIPYTFTVDGKSYKGTIGALGKSAEELITDSVYYLPENPEINSAQPAADYEHISHQGMWNWRLYLSIITGLITIGSIMKDKEKPDAASKPSHK